ncbi:glycoside hydrolase family 16 protein [Paractinoplanes atraurantiacus]|uniref:Beta-glucanase, GH16 family n=1 Tax=Paractinoplanes atraurantiacus TaxID=1036182 RepID=A0A285HBS3_9ACTN|nr:glycoside hydrolase family 16 protein [Actinoplanes atraurantiacus]SNY33190.1 Beta-glucanase, GH16 family [Actinoplanes atraurantiacus]
MRSLIAATAAALLLAAPVPASAAPSDLSGWSVASQSGSVTLRQVTALKGGPAKTAVEVRSPGGSGSWVYALSTVKGMTFEVGRTYRMTAYLRDLGGAGRRYGMLLANGAWQHRPSTVSEYVSPANAGWQRITRTFMATAPGAADTGLYFALPASGAFTVQIADASVRAVTAYTPRSVRSAPTRTIGFSGAEGTAPDATVWNRQTGGGGWGNGERQVYTSSTANAQVDGSGKLKITALRTGDGGYTSARLTTEGKVTVAPGSYVEASITAPTGEAVWPAFWLLGANMPAVGWPACGELDVFEGTGSEPTRAKSAVHLAGRSYDWSEGTTDLGVPLDAGSHRFGVYFDAKTVRFFVDRKPTMVLWASDVTASGRTWPFAKPQFMLLNVAVAGDATPAFSARTMTVGPISIWRGGVPA